MSFVISPAPDANAAYDAIGAPLQAFNETAVGDAEVTPFALTVTRPGDDAVLGGLWAQSVWGSFFIHLLVAPDDGRGHGLGSELMRRAEAEARARGCRHMALDTYAFQARPFYERLGFEVFGQLDGPAPMFPRYFMRKLLA